MFKQISTTIIKNNNRAFKKESKVFELKFKTKKKKK